MRAKMTLALAALALLAAGCATPATLKASGLTGAGSPIEQAMQAPSEGYAKQSRE